MNDSTTKPKEEEKKKKNREQQPCLKRFFFSFVFPRINLLVCLFHSNTKGL